MPFRNDKAQPKTALAVDNGAKFEGYSVVVGNVDPLNIKLDLPDKKVIVPKRGERRTLRRARRQRYFRRPPKRLAASAFSPQPGCALRDRRAGSCNSPRDRCSTPISITAKFLQSQAQVHCACPWRYAGEFLHPEPTEALIQQRANAAAYDERKPRSARPGQDPPRRWFSTTPSIVFAS